MRILVTGAGGNLGAYAIDALLAGRHEVIAWTGSAGSNRAGVPLRPVDLAGDGWESDLARADPEAVLHLAAISSAEAARRDPDRASAVNATATGRLAAWCGREGWTFVFTSTDLVFDGKKSWYREDDPPSPALVYGHTKRDGEEAALAAPGSLVARLPLLFGPSRCGRPAFYDRAVAALGRGEPQTFFEDEFRTPLDYASAAKILVRLIEVGARGILHVAGAERVSRFAMMARIARGLGVDASLVRANRQCDAASAEPRPADVSLDTSRLAATLPGLRRPTIEEAVAGG